jgi:fused signal recognition particle receptor
MLSVPEPLPNDPEDVVSALEFAEHYGKQGDLKEAVRWVRRAAEIAGDTGSDERALTLARAVADLNISASQPPQAPTPEAQPPAAPQAQPASDEAPPEIPSLQAQPTPVAQPAPQAQPQSAELPPPPPLPGAGSASYDPDGDAETRVVDSAQVLADFHKQSNGNGSALSTPIGGIAGLAPAAVSVPTPVVNSVPTPIAASVPTPVATEVETVPEPPPPPPSPPSAAMVDTAPAPNLEAEDSTPPSRRPVSSMAELLARKEAEVSSARAAAESAEPTDTTWDEPPPPPPPQASTPPVERRTAHPAADRISTPLIPSQPYLERAPVIAPIHQAVRASIVATAEPGVFVLRVLTADQGPAPTGHEVLVVVTDPTSSPFKR